MKTIGKCVLMTFATIGFIFCLCMLCEAVTVRPEGWKGQRVSIHQQQYEITNALELSGGYQVMLKEVP